MKNTPVGVILEGQHTRDAIHVAIAPVVAAHGMFPGTHIGIKDGKASVHVKDTIGIVDPFLKVQVGAGEQFFMFLYPGTITSLAHVWAHPAFEAVEPPVETRNKMEVESDARNASKLWIEDYANTLGITYSDLMEGAAEWIRSGDYLVRGGTLQGETVKDEFWPHYENVTGIPVEEGKRDSFFSCSC